MKKFLAIFSMMFLAVLAFMIPMPVLGANTVKVGPQITIAWDAVTGFPGSTIQYQVWYRTDSSGTPSTAGAPIYGATQATVTFTIEGIYDVGVQSQRVINGVVVTSSSVSWSNDSTVVQGGNTFVDQFLANPPNPINLRIPTPPAGSPGK